MALRQGAAQIFTQGLAGFCQPEHIPWPCCYQHLSQLVQSYLDCVHSSFMTLGLSVAIHFLEIKISCCWSYTGTSLPVQTNLLASSYLIWLGDWWKGGWVNSQWEELVIQGSDAVESTASRCSEEQLRGAAKVLGWQVGALLPVLLLPKLVWSHCSPLPLLWHWPSAAPWLDDPPCYSGK